MPHCPLEIRASAKDNEMGAEYFSKNKDKIRKELLKYDRNRPYQKEVCFYNKCVASKEVQMPSKIILGAQCEDVMDRLRANDIYFYPLERDTVIKARRLRVPSCSCNMAPIQYAQICRGNHQLIIGTNATTQKNCWVC